jgi:hypothetical protein
LSLRRDLDRAGRTLSKLRKQLQRDATNLDVSDDAGRFGGR